MKHGRLILLAVLATSGCATPPVQKDPDPVPTTPAPSALRCHDPHHLVRDLTVPWSRRTYVIAPCANTGSPMSTEPAPDYRAVERSAHP